MSPWLIILSLVSAAVLLAGALTKKFWAAFFGLSAVFTVGVSLLAPAYHWWLPGGAQSPMGTEIDDLFYMILIITTVTYIGVHVVLIAALVKFGNRTGGKATFSHGSHALEVVWTIVPAAILLFISLYQIDVWMRFRNFATFNKHSRENPVAEVTARQFEWRIRYPAPGKKLMQKPQPDDLYTVNDLHVPFGEPVVIQLRSEDVLHSFFLPHLRIKQDAVPGAIIPVQFQANFEGEQELVCAELCGWGHYKMRGQLTAQRKSEFDKYLRDLQARQSDDGVSGGRAAAVVTQATPKAENHP